MSYDIVATLGRNLPQFQMTPQIWAYSQMFLILFAGILHYLSKCRKAALGFYPSSIVSVTEIDPETNDFRQIFPNQPSMLANESSKCYYVLKVWQQDVSGYKEYFLSAQHLKNAVRVMDIACLGYLQQSYVVAKLAQYHSQMDDIVKQRKLFEITYGKTSIIGALKPFEASIYMDDNVTPQAMVLLFAYLQSKGGQAQISSRPDRVCITDFDFEEKHIPWNEFVFSSSKTEEEKIEDVIEEI